MTIPAEPADDPSQRLASADHQGEPVAAQNALRSGAAPWRHGRFALPRHWLDSDVACDVVVVGSGITGSLAAEALSRQGRSVVVVDRFEAGRGSTAASTAMLLWEIDTPLRELAARVGFDTASGIYRRSLAAVADLGQLITTSGIPCGYTARSSLYLAGVDSGREALHDEFVLRERAGLPGRWLERGRLADDFEMDRSAAILSPGSAEVDPVLLANGMLQRAIGMGARLVEDQVIDYDWDSRAAWVRLAGGAAIEARHIVLATGYRMPDFVRSQLHRIRSTWCLATAPMPDAAHWRDHVLIWEDTEPYLYARVGPAGQLIAGGEDQATASTGEREALSAGKIATLAAKLRALWPRSSAGIDTVWSAEFGETSDGLPLIGRIPAAPRCLAAYGYGGNGITFSYMASRMLSALIAGESRPWFDDFAIDRPAG